MIKALNQIIQHGHFPDGSLSMKYCLISTMPIQIEWNYESDEELFTLICLTKHLRKINPDIDINLSMPYIPHARMDRCKDKNHDIFTLKYFAEIINSLGFKNVTVLDPHSSVSEALIDRIDIVRPTKLITNVIDKITKINGSIPLIYYPDEGACKKYSDLIKMPYVYGIKNRNWEDGKILSLDVIGDREMIKDRNILIIDDIITYGGSMNYGAIQLREMGCKNIYAFASHVENSILDEKQGQLIKSGLITKIFTTDSIYTGEHDLIDVIKL